MHKLYGIIAALPLVAVASQAQPSRALPPQTPIPGAPTSECSFSDIGPDSPIRITTGHGPIPYQFACGYNRPPGVCAIYTLPPGLVVNFGREQNGWACVTGGEDFTSGWVPLEHLAPVPDTPHVSLSEWLGWWRQGEDARGINNDRLLITHNPGSNVLHISGRAYWYGSMSNVHFGEVQADAMPIGIYLHAVDGGCVIDLKLDLTSRALKAYDNEGCGGMNVRFRGTWTRFTPKHR